MIKADFSMDGFAYNNTLVRGVTGVLRDVKRVLQRCYKVYVGFVKGVLQGSYSGGTVYY